MAYFRYRSADQNGKIIKGSLEAMDKASAIYIIKQKDLIPLEVLYDKDFSRSLRKLKRQKVPIKDMAVFCRQFATILTAGITVLSAMDMLRDQTPNKLLRKGIEDAFEDIKKGMTLSQSLRERGDIFPELLISMIEAGELSGTLDSTMNRMAVHYEKESRIAQKIKSAMTYPVILLSLSLLMVIYMVYFVLPNVIMLLDTSESDIPALTQALINTTEYARTRWYVIAGAFIAINAAFRYIISKEAGRRLYHRILLRIPVLGKTMGKIAVSRFTRTLGILLESAVPMLSSLESVRNVCGNAVAEEAINNAMAAVKNGEGLAASLEESPIFDSMMTKMIRIGEETGTLDEMLVRTSDFFESEVETELMNLMLLLEPAMLIIMGVIVGTIVMAMLLPMYTQLNALGV